MPEREPHGIDRYKGKSPSETFRRGFVEVTSAYKQFSEPSPTVPGKDIRIYHPINQDVDYIITSLDNPFTPPTPVISVLTYDPDLHTTAIATYSPDESGTVHKSVVVTAEEDTVENDEEKQIRTAILSNFDMKGTVVGEDEIEALVEEVRDAVPIIKMRELIRHQEENYSEHTPKLSQFAGETFSEGIRSAVAPYIENRVKDSDGEFIFIRHAYLYKDPQTKEDTPRLELLQHYENTGAIYKRVLYEVVDGNFQGTVYVGTNQTTRLLDLNHAQLVCKFMQNPEFEI